MKIRKGLPVGKAGFTLIELLIVIAILGTLAVVILIALNPVQQLARTRDAGRISGVTQLGHAVEAYATSNNGQYFDDSATWANALVTAGEIAVVPALITNSLTGYCTGHYQGWCYDVNGANTGATVYAALESDSQNSKCASSGGQSYAVYSTADSRGGIVCSVASPGSNQSFVE